MKSKFLTDRALFLEPDKILIISDLHLGIERELSESGITIPSQLEKIQKRIKNLIKQTKTKHLIILGDVKHQIPNISWQEYRDIPKLFENLKVKISIVKGNHDGFIERIVPKDVKIYKTLIIKNFAFVHGHAWFSKKALDCEYLITSHVHPAIEFYTNNFRSVEHCWLKCDINKKKLEKKFKRKCKLKQGIIMPVFNPLIGGMSFNSKDFKPIGPILKILNWENAEVYLLDGTFLGKLNNIKT